MEKNDLKEKEINLLDLIQMFFGWLKKLSVGLLHLTGYSLRLLFRHKILTAVIFLFSVLCGLYLSRSSARVYKAEAMAVLNGSIVQTVKEVSKQLEVSSKLSDFTTLSSKLSLPDSIAESIAGIESFYVIDYLNDSTPDAVDFKRKHSLMDTLNVKMPNRLFFRVETRNISMLPVFEEAFLNYFNTNERLVREFEAKHKIMSRRTQLNESEINRIDSLAELSYFKEREQQLQVLRNSLLVGEQWKQLLYRDLWTIQKVQMEDEFELATFTAPVVFPTGFIVNPTPVNGRLKCLAISLAVWIAASLLLSLLVENRKCIFNYLSKK